MTESAEGAECPALIADYADQAVSYVERALGIPLEFDSDTLPLLDHYLRTVPDNEPAMMTLVAATAGAYFGEVVRRVLGGMWGEIQPEEPATWRLILPGGLSFSPASMALGCMTRDDQAADPRLDAPPKMWPHVESALGRMGNVSEDAYYSLSGRFDTLEHLQAVILATAADELAKRESSDKPLN